MPAVRPDPVAGRPIAARTSLCLGPVRPREPVHERAVPAHPPHRPPTALAGCRRLLHASPRRHHPQHRAAEHGQFAERKPAAHAGGGDRLPAHGGPADTGLGVDRRPFRHAPGVPRRGTAVQPRLVALRAVAEPRTAGRGAHRTGRRRRADDAGGTAGDPARLPAPGPGAGAQLRHHSRPARPAGGTDAGRLAGGVRLLALDLPDQPAGRPARLPGGDEADAGPAQPGAEPFRQHRLPALRRLHGADLHRPGRTRRAAPVAPARGPAADRRTGPAHRLLAARATHRQAAVPHRTCSRRGPSPSASSATCSPAWAAAPCPSSPRCCCRWDWATALHRGHDHDPAGAVRDGRQADGQATAGLLRLSQAAGRQHPDPRLPDRRLRPGRPGHPLRLAAAAPEPARRGELPCNSRR